ncbi:MAG: InlB B-repeat-containing protein [Clostridia bacterium]|nr:InlB B-repeat-containing protein [Clostridia bacterium]
MKKKLFIFSIIAVLIVFLVVLTSCGEDDNSNTNTSTQDTQEYTIQYTDDTGVQKLTVKGGEQYALKVIPERNGYEFTGLFDSPSGGTQYISAQGTSLSKFNDKKDIVLFPQFKAKEYKLYLDYQGAPVTQSREIEVSYDYELKSLPLDLKIENMVFVGWFTEPNGEGNQVANANGTISKNAKITEKTFDLTEPDGYITLYAYFKTVEHTVTFYIGSSSLPEEVKVEHGTYIQEIQIDAEEEGKKVLSWSKTKNDTTKSNIFEGKILEDMILYSCEFAPYIEFETNGGEAINNIIAPAGQDIYLPTAYRNNYKFMGWIDKDSNPYTNETMPSENIKLTAVWQPMLVFDETGGDDVVDIALNEGEELELPATQKAGYIFAGWYTQDNVKFIETKMPSTSVVLKAGWYKEQSRSFIIQDRTWTKDLNLSATIDFSSYFNTSEEQTIKVYCYFNIATKNPNIVNSLTLNFYEVGVVTENIGSEKINDLTKAHQTYEFTKVFTVNDDVTISLSNSNCTMYDCYYTVYYANMNTLYF